MLRDPKTAVYSYMVWISYAYLILDSEPAFKQHVFDEFEEVRVNSYVELNKQRGKRIDQRIGETKVKSMRTKEPTATVALEENWRYRYIDLKSGTYTGPWYDVTYDSTYTVVKDPEYGWQVHGVSAQPRGEVK